MLLRVVVLQTKRYRLSASLGKAAGAVLGGVLADRGRAAHAATVSEGIKVGSTIETPCAHTGYGSPGFKVDMDLTRTTTTTSSTFVQRRC